MTSTKDAESDLNRGRAPLTAQDFLAIDSGLSDEERLIRDTVHAFVRRDLLDRLQTCSDCLLNVVPTSCSRSWVMRTRLALR